MRGTTLPITVDMLYLPMDEHREVEQEVLVYTNRRYSRVPWSPTENSGPGAVAQSSTQR
jgi:hypothetical protein